MKRLGIIICVVGAIIVHGGFLLFGGLLFATPKDNQGTIREVDLIGPDDVKKDEEKPKDQPPEELKSDEELPPDVSEVIKSLDMPVMNDAPALDTANLSAIEAALGGGSGGGDFGMSVDFGSGGRIGGTGKGGSANDQLEKAFNLSEIDQKPRAVFQSPPVFPSEMRGKKVEGIVMVLFIVDAAGKVNNPRVEKSSHPAFEKPAIDAVKRWKFEPGLKGGQRVPCKMRVPIRFQPS
jgi:protein TonB